MNVSIVAVKIFRMSKLFTTSGAHEIALKVFYRRRDFLLVSVFHVSPKSEHIRKCFLTYVAALTGIVLGLHLKRKENTL